MGRPNLKALRARTRARGGIPGCRFAIVGLPRSGTTYLMTLLNSHPEVLCHGELFNPYAVIEADRRDETAERVLARDSDPAGFLETIWSTGGRTAVGFKFMLGHNVAVLRVLMTDPDIRLICVRRDNRAAQAASWIAAVKRRAWATTRPKDREASDRIDAAPRRVSQVMHEFATTDMLFDAVLETASRPVLRIEYRELFAPEIAARLCDFLGVRRTDALTSPLQKQGRNRIIDRFEKPAHIRNYFRRIGREDWLDEEL